jgi:hypothetical protein
MTPHAEDPLHPEELSRRISEIDLTNLRRCAENETGNPPRYTQAQLLAFRPTERDEGVKTPTSVPAPPPPTPSNHPGSLAVHDTLNSRELADDDINAAEADDEGTGDEPKKKKKKKKSGRGEKKQGAPTGFEGEHSAGFSISVLTFASRVLCRPSYHTGCV